VVPERQIPLRAGVPLRERKRIAIDEKEIDINGKKVYLWTVVDVDNEEVIAVMVTRWRCSLDTLRLLGRVVRKCAGKLPRVLIDGGDWYPWALQRYGFRYTVVHFGPHGLQWNDGSLRWTGEYDGSGRLSLRR